ncbi:MAG TPA: tetratricopeptide repeat protein [Sphingomicrobium sp.]|nr:tetratricopeptide repeat protein [Sphingomicrobium sp.]
MRLTLTASLLVLAAIPAAYAFAAPPSGGGGSSAPSRDAPDFDAAAEYRKGVDALKAKRFAEAKKAFNNVLGVAPRDANVNFLAGMAYAGLNDFKGAAKHYERAVRANGKLIPAQQELAITYVKLGDRAKAEAALGKLRQLDQACRGTCKEGQELKEAISAVQAALGQPSRAELQTDPPLLFASAEAGDSAYLDAVALINEKRYEQAIVSLERARVSFGAHPDILTYLGFANRKLHRYGAAESYYRQALAAAPRHKGATEYYGELMIERGDLAGARKMLAKLDAICTFGCAEADELRRWIDARGAPES